MRMIVGSGDVSCNPADHVKTAAFKGYQGCDKLQHKLLFSCQLSMVYIQHHLDWLKLSIALAEECA